MFFAGVLQARD